MYQYFWSNCDAEYAQKGASAKSQQMEKWLRQEQVKGQKMISRVASLKESDPSIPEVITQLNSCPPPTRKNPQFLLSGYLAVKTKTSWSKRWNCRYVVLTPHFLYVFKRPVPIPGQHAHAQVIQMLNQTNQGSLTNSQNSASPVSTSGTSQGKGSAQGINESSALMNDMYLAHPTHEQYSSLEIFGEIRDKIPIDSSLAVIDAGGLFFQVSHPNDLRVVFRTLNPRHTALWKGAIRTAVILSSHSIQSVISSLPLAIEAQRQQLQLLKEKEKGKIPASPSVADHTEKETNLASGNLLQQVLSNPTFGVIPHINRLIPAYTDRSSLISSVSVSYSQVTPHDLTSTGLLSSPLTFVTSQNRDPHCTYPEIVLERNINWGEEIVIPLPQAIIDKFQKANPNSPVQSVVVTMQDGGHVVLDAGILYQQALQANINHTKGSSAERNATVNSNFSFADAVFPVENSFYNADVHVAWRFVAGKSKDENSVATTSPVADEVTTSAAKLIDPTNSIPALFKQAKRNTSQYKSEISGFNLLALILSIVFAVALNNTLRDSISFSDALVNIKDAYGESYDAAFKAASPFMTFVIGTLLAVVAIIYSASNVLQLVLSPYAKRINKYIPVAGSYLSTVSTGKETKEAKEKEVSRDNKEKNQRISLASLPHFRMIFVRLIDNQSPTGPVLLNGVPFHNTSWPVLPASAAEASPSMLAYGISEDASVNSQQSTTRHTIPVRRRRVQLTDITFGESAGIDFDQFAQEPIEDIFPTDFSDDEDEDDETENSVDRTQAEIAPEEAEENFVLDPYLGRTVSGIWGRWSQSDYRPINLRGMDYLTNKKKPKIPATQHRFEVAFSTIEAVMTAVSHCASKSDSYFMKEKNIMTARGKGAQWGPGTPLKFLCVNWLVPGEPNYNFIAYFRNPYIYPWCYSDSPTTSHAIETQRSIKEAIELGEDVVNERFDTIGNENCKAYYPKSDAFFRLMNRFLEGTPEFKTSRFKYIPNIVVGPWFVRKTAGQTPCILGNKLKQIYYEDADKQYLEIDVDISTAQAAGTVLKVVKGSAKALEIDMHFLLEPQAEDELPEALWGGVRIMNIDLINIPMTYHPEDEE